MKTFAIAACGFVALSTAAFAQAVVVAPEDETIVRDYATQEHWRSIDPPSGFVIREGADIPDTVELREVPRLPRYRAAIIGGRTVLVEPRTRRVVRIIER